MRQHLKKLVSEGARDAKRYATGQFKARQVKDKPKIFCIGRNKTGTTSLRRAFEDLDFVVGNQPVAEKLLPYYRDGKYQKIINYCRTAQVFQDFPFSFPETYKYLDAAFPDAKFILTVRDTPAQWYESVVRFQSKLFGNGELPTKDDLQNGSYVWKGWIWECSRLVYGTPEDDPYHKPTLIDTYNRHNFDVMDHFEGRTDKLLVLNVSEEGSYTRMMDFLGIQSPRDEFPWENRT